MAVFFTLRLISVTAWAIALSVFGLAALSGLRRQVLFVLVASNWALRLSLVGHVLLIRRVEHRRLALLDILQTFLVLVLSVGLAWTTRSIWALAVTPGVTAGVNWFFLAVYRPVWKPRLGWDADAVRYFLRFGGRTVGGMALATALDYVDDLWTGYSLGDAPLGYYSRAYRFAAYPRVILSEPVNTVTVGMYAELKSDRLNLSRAFFRVNALLVRAGFLLAGWLAVIAPQLIVLFLGARWLPMLAAYRLMLIYTLLDPIKITVANVLIAAGRPGLASLARLAQFAVLLSGLYALGPRWGIVGVALAVDGMLAAGIFLLLVFARRVADFSPLRLFLAPALALAAGVLAGGWVGDLSFIRGNDWVALAAKSTGVVLAYAVVLLALERRQLIDVLRWIAAVYGEGRWPLAGRPDPDGRGGSEL
jgi:O-antigen/teichoic acid export membrane protein